MPATAAAMAAVCSGVEPQHEPATLSRPARAHSPRAARHLGGRLVVAAQLVGEAGVGVGGQRDVGEADQLLDVLAQLLRAEGAVEPDEERVRVPDARPEGLQGLAGQRAARGVHDRPGDHHREAEPQVVEQPADREDRGLGVEGVEDGLDEQEVRAARDLPLGRLAVGLRQLLEGDVAGRRVVDVRAERARAVGGAEGAGDVRGAGRRGPPPRRRPRGPGGRPPR